LLFWKFVPSVGSRMPFQPVLPEKKPCTYGWTDTTAVPICVHIVYK
jgi:hypothetical protein